MSTLTTQRWLGAEFDPTRVRQVLLPAAVLTLACALGAMTGILDPRVAALGFAALIGLPVLAVGFVRLDIGVSLMLGIAFSVEFLRRYTDLPFGLALDGLLVLLAISLVAQLAKAKNLAFVKHPISYMVLIWMYYCFFELLNPWALSRLAWVFTVRSLAGLLFLYFIALYTFDTLPKIKMIIKVILGLGLAAALYGLKQEFIGFSNTEIAWLNADPERFQLIVQWSRYRVFSVFSEPTTAGIVMAYLGCMCVVLLTGPYTKWTKAILAVAFVCMMLTLGFAGSRTPVAMVPAGLFFFVLLFPRKYILIIGAVILGFGALGVLKSSSNPVIHRLQSTFKPGEDASVQVRMDNQRIIQPFIRSRPVGSGLGSTGVWGKRFNPQFWLADFAHDSGLVRIAVEAGWIGLTIYMAFLWVILVTGIRQYFRARDPVIKNLTLAIVVAMFMLVLASYPQEAIPMLPTSLIFYVLLACLVNLGRIERKLRTLDEVPAAKRKRISAVAVAAE